jgi:chromosomal replication initiator protein
MIVTIKDVERAVCLRFRITREQLLMRGPARAISRPRAIAMYLARELTGASFPRLGQYFERDHSTVLYACRMVAKRTPTDSKLAVEVEICREIIKHSDRWMEKVARDVSQRGLEVST